MTILLTFDEGYAPHAAVVMESTIAHCPEKLKFAVVHYNLSRETIECFQQHFINRIHSLNFIKIPQNEFCRFQNTKTLGHIKNPEVVLLRLFCDYVPEDDYLLYLDCDIIVNDNVLKVLSYINPNVILSAVTEYNTNYKNKDLTNLLDIQVVRKSCGPWRYEAYWHRTFKDLSMNPYGRYFCAGVMLINMKQWRLYDIGGKCLDYIEKNPDKCVATDQDALNHILDGNYIELPARWNDRIALNSAICSGYSITELQEAKQNPAIYHIAGSRKPWHYRCDKKYRDMYSYYRKLTPWPKLIYPDRNIKNLIVGGLKRMIMHTLSMRCLDAIRYFKNYHDCSFFSTARVK